MTTARISDLATLTSLTKDCFVIHAPPPIRSKLRIVAGSDLVTFNYPQPVPNWFVRLMTRLLLRMEWVEVHPLGEP